MSLLEILASALLLVGVVFLLASALGVVRFPDFYTRLHAGGKGDTLGQAMIVMGLLLLGGLTIVSLKLALIAFFILIFNPAAAHALAHGAWVCGVRPWTGQPRPFRQSEHQVDDAERAALLAAGDESVRRAWKGGDGPRGPGAEGAGPGRGGPQEGSWTT